jgi:putative transposase
MHLFGKDADFEAFERVMIAAHRRHPIRILSYCVLSNHWHFYVERNALGAGLVARAEQWRFSGLWARMHGDNAIQAVLSAWPVKRPVDWTDRVNSPLSAKELRRLKPSLERGRPFGEDEWANQMAKELRLEHSIRPGGRPPKPKN